MFKNLYWWLLIVAVFFLSIQILSVVIYIYSFIPYPAFWSDPFLKGIEPQRQTLFYAVFLFTTVLLTVLGVIFILPKLSKPGVFSKFKLWLGLEFVWVFLMMFCFFKWTTYRYPFWNILAYENSSWVEPFFWVTCVLAVLSKFFFPEIQEFTRRLRVWAGKESFLKSSIIPLQIIFIIGVVLLLYIPHLQDVTALAFVWDQWNHLDRVTSWFIRHGWCISYEETIQILIMIAIAYIIGLFYFIRWWLNSWLLAAAGALLVIKMGMFYYGASPCVWINPANTFLAHGWDIVLLFGLGVISVKWPSKLYAAALGAGLVLIVGWLKSNGYMDALGLDNQPMMAPLRARQFFPFFMGYFVPVFYVLSLLVLLGQTKTQQSTQRRLPVIICIYGLMIFVDYIEHPMTGFYGSLMMPAILIMLWWLRQIVASSTILTRRFVYAGVFLLALGSLLTNRLMVIYPNVFFQDKTRFATERGYLEHFDVIAPSASLIDQLTKEDENVILLSNFETALLMQANRQSLFENTPIMFSKFNKEPGGLNMATKQQCLGLIRRLEIEKPSYVFVDERLWALEPQALGNTGLNVVLSYIHHHYQIYKREGFLVALKRQ